MMARLKGSKNKDPWPEDYKEKLRLIAIKREQKKILSFLKE